MIKTKSGARKIEGTDNWREIFDDHNYTVDALDQLADDMAIIVNGNKTAYASGAAVGQYVLLRNSTITDRADGMYKAAKAIPYNTTIDKTYLTAVSGGAINSLSDQIGNIVCGTVEGLSVAGNTNYASNTISFGKTFTSPPSVVASPYISANAQEISHIVISEVTTTGFKFRLRNTYSSTLNDIKVNWIAIGS